MEQADKHFILRIAERISFCFDIYLGDVGGKQSCADHEDVNVERMSKPAKKKLIFSNDDMSPLPVNPPPDAPSEQESQQRQPPQQSMTPPQESLISPPAETQLWRSDESAVGGKEGQEVKKKSQEKRKNKNIPPNTPEDVSTPKLPIAPPAPRKKLIPRVIKTMPVIDSDDDDLFAFNSQMF
ncbi:uncharacterized protein LOC135101517 [Scylla paramamosain]|uniref:uncharacterized protein LOC135101517 n=1 Tax=Scylla paramamosain TaxID=85552 RepID=UPI0030830FF8